MEEGGDNCRHDVFKQGSGDESQYTRGGVDVKAKHYPSYSTTGGIKDI